MLGLREVKVDLGNVKLENGSNCIFCPDLLEVDLRGGQCYYRIYFLGSFRVQNRLRGLDKYISQQSACATMRT